MIPAFKTPTNVHTKVYFRRCLQNMETKLCKYVCKKVLYVSDRVQEPRFKPLVQSMLFTITVRFQSLSSPDLRRGGAGAMGTRLV